MAREVRAKTATGQPPALPGRTRPRNRPGESTIKQHVGILRNAGANEMGEVDRRCRDRPELSSIEELEEDDNSEDSQEKGVDIGIGDQPGSDEDDDERESLGRIFARIWNSVRNHRMRHEAH